MLAANPMVAMAQERWCQKVTLQLKTSHLVQPLHAFHIGEVNLIAQENKVNHCGQSKLVTIVLPL